MCRLARHRGVKRINRTCYKEACAILWEYFLGSLLRDTINYTEHARRRTVTVADVVYALRRHNRPIYSFATNIVRQETTRPGEQRRRRKGRVVQERSWHKTPKKAVEECKRKKAADERKHKRAEDRERKRKRAEEERNDERRRAEEEEEEEERRQQRERHKKALESCKTETARVMESIPTVLKAWDLTLPKQPYRHMKDVMVYELPKDSRL